MTFLLVVPQPVKLVMNYQPASLFQLTLALLPQSAVTLEYHSLPYRQNRHLPCSHPRQQARLAQLQLPLTLAKPLYLPMLVARSSQMIHQE